MHSARVAACMPSRAWPRASSLVSVAGLVTALLMHLGFPCLAESGSTVTVRGVVQGNDMIQKGPCPRGNCEWMNFIIAPEDTTTTLVAVEMRERVIEGTVFVDSTVVVEGKRNDRNAVRADRITDLKTGATIGYNSPALRHPNGQRLTLEGEVYELQPKEPPHRGQRSQVEKWRFLLRTPANPPAQPTYTSVELVKRQIFGILRQNVRVRVDGRWTKRNVLRADSVQIADTGEIVN